jgi:[ribosomal protein S5]-alanine N-acetyltransferase
MTLALPPLSTPRLQLRSGRAEDLEALWQLWNEPLVRRYLFDDAPLDRSTAQTVLESCLAQVEKGGGLWIVYSRLEPRFLGCAALLPTSVAAEHEPRLAGLLEPTIAIEPGNWKIGYASETLAAVLGYAFDTLSRDLIAAVNDVPNIASERMLTKAGFSVLSEVKGRKYPMRTYTLSSLDWSARNDT